MTPRKTPKQIAAELKAEQARLAAEQARLAEANGHGEVEDIPDLPDGPDDAHLGDDPKHAMFVDWSDFWRKDRTEPDWLVDDVLARGRAHELYATHKHGKSLLMLFLVARLAVERSDVVVVYLDFEMGEDDLYDRLGDMGYSGESDLSRLRYALLPSLPPLDSAEGGATLLAILDEEVAKHPDCHPVVIIDTISRATVGEENSNDTIQAFYRHTGLGLKQRRATWVRLDHAGKDTRRGPRGGSAKSDDVDIVWHLTATDSGVQLRRNAARMGWVPESVAFSKLEDPTLRFVPVAAAWPDGTAATARALDAATVPLNAGRPAARKRLAAVGHSCGNDVLAAALKYRRIEAERPPEAVRTASRTAHLVLVADSPADSPGETPPNPASQEARTGRADSLDSSPRTFADSPGPLGPDSPRPDSDEGDKCEAEVTADLAAGGRCLTCQLRRAQTFPGEPICRCDEQDGDR